MKMQELIEEYKKQQNVSRQDIADLLKSIGKPGENLQEKLEAVAELNLNSPQEHSVESTLDEYEEF